MTLTRRRIVAIVLAGTAAVLLYPFESTITHRWNIRAVRPDGGTIEGCAVEQHWRWKAVGVDGRERKTTDASGYALFPERKTRASLMRRFIGNVQSIGFHTSAPVRLVEFVGCADASKPLGIYQLGDSMTYSYVIEPRPTVVPLSPPPRR